MGTDRHEDLRQPCPCDKGQIEIDWVTADHPYANPFKGNFKLALRCESCRKEYVLTEQDKKAVLLKRDEFEEREKEQHQIYERGRTLASSDAVQGYLKELTQRLERTSTAIGKYRLLSSAGYYMSSKTTFNKELKRRSLEDMVFRSFDIWRVERLLHVIGKNDAELVKQVAEMNQRREELQKPLTAVGDPIAVLTTDAFFERHK